MIVHFKHQVLIEAVGGETIRLIPNWIQIAIDYAAFMPLVSQTYFDIRVTGPYERISLFDTQAHIYYTHNKTETDGGVSTVGSRQGIGRPNVCWAQPFRELSLYKCKDLI